MARRRLPSFAVGRAVLNGEFLRAEDFVPDAASHVVLFKRTPPSKAIWTTAGEPSRLDEEGAQLVLVGTDDEPEQQLGIEVLPASPDAARWS